MKIKNSIYLKTILFFLIVFFVSSITIISILVSAFYSSINANNGEYLSNMVGIVDRLLDNGLDDDLIEEMVTSNKTVVYIHNSYEEIDQSFTNKINANQKSLIDSDNTIFIRDDIIFIVLKINNKYCVFQYLETPGDTFDLQTAILFSSIITITFAVFMVIMGIGAVVRPLYKISEASRKIAQGNYDITIEPRKDNDALGQLISDFNAMSRKLSKTELLRKDFLSAISHEFKTPMQSIYGFANILREETSNTTHKEYLERICDEAQRLSSLSNNILQLNNLDNMINPSTKNTYCLDEQIRQSILIFENKWNEKNIELNVDLDKINLTANQDMMKQVFINLIDNSIKFTQPYGSIEICLKHVNNKIVFTIKDTGKEISDKEKENIFEKFYKCDTSRKSSGYGLGLTIVKKILDLHGYSIRIENAKPYGNMFIIVMTNN